MTVIIWRSMTEPHRESKPLTCWYCQGYKLREKVPEIRHSCPRSKSNSPFHSRRSSHQGSRARQLPWAKRHWDKVELQVLWPQATQATWYASQIARVKWALSTFLLSARCVKGKHQILSPFWSDSKVSCGPPPPNLGETNARVARNSSKTRVEECHEQFRDQLPVAPFSLCDCSRSLASGACDQPHLLAFALESPPWCLWHRGWTPLNWGRFHRCLLLRLRWIGAAQLPLEHRQVPPGSSWRMFGPSFFNGRQRPLSALSRSNCHEVPGDLHPSLRVDGHNYKQ